MTRRPRGRSNPAANNSNNDIEMDANPSTEV